MTELLSISLGFHDQKFAILGSWICSHLAEKKASIFEPIQEEILHFLESTDHQSSLRNWMKVMTFLNFKEELHGRIIDLCIRFIEDSNNKVALQMYSIQLLIPFMRLYPELLPEIDAIIELHAVNKTPAYHSIARKFKKATKNI